MARTYGKKIKRNAIRCSECGDVIESKYRWDFKWCECMNVGVDGGLDYLKRSALPGAEYEELSEYDDLTP